MGSKYRKKPVVQLHLRGWWKGGWRGAQAGGAGHPVSCRGGPGLAGSDRNQEETRGVCRKGMKPGVGRRGSSHLLPELPQLVRASPVMLAFSAPGACSWDLMGAFLSVVLVELSRELLLELGAVVSRCCCSGPGAPWALLAGRCGCMGRRGQGTHQLAPRPLVRSPPSALHSLHGTSAPSLHAQHFQDV